MERHITGTTPVRAGLAACALLGAAACAVPPAPASGPAQMWIHFDGAAEMQFALVQGDLARAQRAARRVEQATDTAGLPGGAEDELQRLRAHARDVREAESFGVAAMAASLLAAGCGECHAAHDVGPRFAPVPAPVDPAAVDHMVEHVWAADRMWEGLVIPSAERWEAGARVLAQHAVPMDILAPGTSGYGLALKALGLEALEVEESRSQARIYAGVLVNCATCHADSGIR